MSATPKPSAWRVFTVSLPLIISGLSSNFAIFADRIILSFYDPEMMAHVTTSSNFSWMFLFSLSGLAYISKVYVGQYNGAKQYHKTSHITWQLIFFSILSIIPFIIAYQLGPFLIPTAVQEHGLIYYQITMLFGFLWPMVSALIGFFIGTYQSTIVMIALLISNLMNIGLDFILIPQYGAAGAAWATVIAQITLTLIMMWMYFSPDNRKNYHTAKIKLDSKLLNQALRLGAPESALHFFEMAAWSTISGILASVSEEHMMMSTLSQNIFILFMFTYSELGNGVKLLASNYVGARSFNYIPQLLLSAFKVHSCFVFGLLLLSVGNPDWILECFSLNDISPVLKSQIILALSGLLVFLFLDGIAYILSNILCAYGDTMANMAITTINMWVFLVIPTYISHTYLSAKPTVFPLIILPFYGAIVTLSYFWRYQSAPIKELAY
ncbi:MATE family efflux transporter [Candidatus Comchoanobacter bicostacola]|uniref:MATE family efflux transporter n=1 Tax=Candidatus Comchoanobacter bicostacola TaxID=2919598 RepID=A0ABY5DMA9_9GAMM|nr:MATE family efflux transporter [Candidatus Comchoanobacter bicostacola]UTC24760.1 MATE family efflux transporter [Candidatus Comchoanobacter bicostacola]